MKEKGERGGRGKRGTDAEREMVIRGKKREISVGRREIKQKELTFRPREGSDATESTRALEDEKRKERLRERRGSRRGASGREETDGTE